MVPPPEQFSSRKHIDQKNIDAEKEKKVSEKRGIVRLTNTVIEKLQYNEFTKGYTTTKSSAVAAKRTIIENE